MPRWLRAVVGSLRALCLLALAACTAHAPADSRVGGLSASAANVSGRKSLPGEGQPSQVLTGTGQAQGNAASASAPDASAPSQTAAPSASLPAAGSDNEFPTSVSTAIPGSTGPSLRDTPVGQAPHFDPDAIYIVGESSEVVATSQRPYGIASLAAPDQGITGIPIFASVYLRRTDGHVLYSYLGSAPNGDGVTKGLFEFKRDEGPYANGSDDALTVGEAVVDNAERPCGPIAPGDGLRYRVGFDGSVLHTCGNTYEMARRAPSEAQYEAWYDSSGKRVYFGNPSLEVVGANGRTLVFPDAGGVVVLDLANGSMLASLMPYKPMIAEHGFNGGASRSREDGFWLAATAADSMNPEATWTDIDLAGQIVGTGVYPDMPEGVMMTTTNWEEHWPALDGRGALYQFAMQGEEGVIVRRPMQGQSEVVYRSSQWDASHPHDVLPDQLVTGP
jgi:hypothetical protein